MSLDEAIAAARTPDPAASQVFLVDPFADDTATGSLRELVEACAPGSGRAVVVAGPCEHPVEEIRVPSEHRAIWDDLTLVPPQLPESVDVELGRMLDSIEVGRRHVSAVSSALTPDPAAEAVALRSTLTASSTAAPTTRPPLAVMTPMTPTITPSPRPLSCAIRSARSPSSSTIRLKSRTWCCRCAAGR